MGAELRIEFVSDWHIGTGRGLPGGVDALVARDPDGCPCIPGKSLTGILRDSAENLASQLGGDWPSFVNELFGDQPGEGGNANPERPRPALISIRLAQLPQRVREVFAGADTTAQLLAKELTTVRSSTSIDEFGVARDDTLRSVEVALAGLTLSAPVRFGGSMADSIEAKYFVAAAARLIDVIGGKRRRGLGRVQVRLFSDGKEVVPPEDDWDLALPEEAPRLKESSHSSTSLKVLDTCKQYSHEGGATIRLEITAMTPLLLASEVRGNQSSTHDFIGGNLLLPIAHRALEQCGVDGSAAIRNGHLIVRRGLPAYGDERLGPAPFVFAEQKGKSAAPWRNRLFETTHSQADTTTESVPYKQVRRGWIGARGTRRTGLPIEERSHNVIEDDTQSTGTAGIYTYRVIAARERFIAEIWVSDELRETLGSERIARLAKEIAGEQSVGRSRKDDYGRVSVTTEIIESGAAHGTTDSRIVLWCVSDVILVGESVRPRTTAEEVLAAFVRALGLAHDLMIDLSSSSVRTRRIDSWSAAWSLPRPTLVSIAAGSVVVARSIEPINLPSRLVIGERQAEGFGEVVVNSPLFTLEEVGHVVSADSSRSGGGNGEKSSTLQGAELAPSERQTLTRLTEAACLRRIQGRASEILNDDGGLEGIGWTRDTPTNAQIGNIRAFVRDLVSKNGVSPLPKALERNLKPKVKDKLKQMIEEPRDVWNLLGTDCLVIPPLLNQQEGEIKDGLRLRAVQIVIETAHQRRTRGNAR